MPANYQGRRSRPECPSRPLHWPQLESLPEAPRTIRWSLWRPCEWSAATNFPRSISAKARERSFRSFGAARKASAAWLSHHVNKRHFPRGNRAPESGVAPPTADPLTDEAVAIFEKTRCSREAIWPPPELQQIAKRHESSARISIYQHFELSTNRTHASANSRFRERALLRNPCAQKRISRLRWYFTVYRGKARL